LTFRLAPEVFIRRMKTSLEQKWSQRPSEPSPEVSAL